MCELAQLPAGVGRAQALLHVEQGGQPTRVRRRSGVEFVRVSRDAYAVPVLELQSVGGRQGQRAEASSRAGAPISLRNFSSRLLVRWLRGIRRRWRAVQLVVTSRWTRRRGALCERSETVAPSRAALSGFFCRRTWHASRTWSDLVMVEDSECPGCPGWYRCWWSRVPADAGLSDRWTACLWSVMTRGRHG